MMLIRGILCLIATLLQASSLPSLPSIAARSVALTHLYSSSKPTLKPSAASPTHNINPTQSFSWLSHFDWRVALAGGMAGGLANAFLLPIDAIKTIRQSDPSLKSSMQALNKLRLFNWKTIYAGIVPVVMGSVPSSALYFGSYETAKSILYKYKDRLGLYTPVAHMLAAMTGNIASSVVFVPSDVVKQRLQVYSTNTRAWTGGLVKNINKISALDIAKDIYNEKGLLGFYPSYQATLMRNIPSAMIRFTIYEELKKIFSIKKEEHALVQSMKHMVAGGLASGVSAIVTCPFDVVKTRLATGIYPPNTPIIKALQTIIRSEGIGGMYAGIQARLVYSAAYGGIGFACFEACKKLVGR